MPDGQPGEIRVALKRETETLSLTVEDDGVGMATEGMPKGTGLGTRIVRAMAQSLQATSQATDPAYRGTRVVFSMPAAA